MKVYTSAVQQRHGEFALPGCLVSWSIVPGKSYSESIQGMTLPDETIEHIIDLLHRLFALLESTGAFLLMDSEWSVYEIGMDDYNLAWDDGERGLWGRKISVKTDR
jgi:hypothetical protein